MTQFMPLPTLRTFPAQHHIARDDGFDFRNINFVLLLFAHIFQRSPTLRATAQLRLLRLTDFFLFRLLAVLELPFAWLASAFARLLDTLLVPSCKRDCLTLACTLQFFNLFAEFTNHFIRLD